MLSSPELKAISSFTFEVVFVLEKRRFSDDNRVCWSKVKHKTMETLMMKLRRSQ
jgi:hypothetical protein